MTTQEAFEIFDIVPSRYDHRIQSQESADAVAQEIIENSLKKFRKMALECHSDLGGSDAQMARIIEARDLIKKLRIQWRPPVQMQRIIIVNAYPGAYSAQHQDATTNTNSYTGYRPW